MRKRKSILIHICAIFVLLIACLPAIYYKNFAPKIDLSNISIDIEIPEKMGWKTYHVDNSRNDYINISKIIEDFLYK